jgi:hypothetical protein
MLQVGRAARPVLTMENDFFEIRNDDLMKRAIASNRALRPRVKCVNAAKRLFYVEPRHNTNRYLVTFTVTPDGKKLAACSNQFGEPCKGLNPRARCYHVAASAACNVYVQTVRRQLEALKVS